MPDQSDRADDDGTGLEAVPCGQHADIDLDETDDASPHVGERVLGEESTGSFERHLADFDGEDDEIRRPDEFKTSGE